MSGITSKIGRSASTAAATPSPLQQRVLHFVAHGEGHGVVEATAGSGKTTTLVQVARLLPQGQPACFLAFNRATAAELRARLPGHVEATTIHALGRSVLVKRFPHLAAVTPNAGKYRALALTLVRGQTDQAAEAEQLAQYLARLASFTRLATGPDGVAPQPDQVARRHGLESPVTSARTAQLQALLPALLAQGLEQVPGGQLDFTDMLYAPLTLRLPPPRYAFVCVDEAQDLSPLTLALVMLLVNAGARALFVGDPRQAIYAFAGADSHSLQRISKATAATVLPLSVSFRCPSRHVALARRYSPSIQAAPGATAGVVRLMNLDQLPHLAAAGDLIMSRVNAPLIGLQLRLAEAGTPARVLGTDMVQPTLALARQLFGGGLPPTAAQLVGQHAKDESHLLERELLTSPALAEVLRISHDRHQALAILLRRLGNLKTSTFHDLENLAHALLGGAPSAVAAEVANRSSGNHGTAKRAPRPPGPVILSTIHKAKGREAKRVFLLFPEELAPAAAPSEPGSTVQGSEAAATEPSDDAAAEANVLFVALTRAKHELVLVERTAGALAARVRSAKAEKRAPPGTDLALARSWDQVLALAQLMAGKQPRRRNRWLTPGARGAARRP
ncbi:MAG: ATP-dependent helicase [Trueperaceae bacterium]